MFAVFAEPGYDSAPPPPLRAKGLSLQPAQQMDLRVAIIEAKRQVSLGWNGVTIYVENCPNRHRGAPRILDESIVSEKSQVLQKYGKKVLTHYI